jgi:iron complex outermembrane recepter protein
VQDELYGSLVTRYNVPGAPAFTQADLNALTLNGLLPISGVLPALNNVKWVYDSRLANIGSTHAQGIDLTGSYDFGETAVGGFDIGAAVSITTKYELQQTPTAPILDQLATIGNPTKYAGRAYLDWNHFGWNSQLALNYVDGYTNNTVRPAQSVDSWTTVDLHLAYTFQSTGAANDLTLSLDANRLFDSEPPRVDLAGGYDPTQASALGRYVMLGIRKTW